MKQPSVGSPNRISVEEVRENSTKVEELLNRHFEIVHNSSILNEKDKQEHERKNLEAKQSFATRQTKITFVGVMKAGKSTCISASTGHPLFPARIAPMTTISTTISHNPERIVPLMKIPDKPYLMMLRVLGEFKQLNLDGAPDHLKTFLQELQKTSFTIEQQVSGAEAINSSLFILNELVRMCCEGYVRRSVPENLLEDLLESFEGLTSFPHIDAAFLTTTEEQTSNGILTLVDTPGPDEIKLSEVLQRLNRIILGDSDAICLVLNSRTPGNEAEGSLFKMVHRYASDKVFAIVNQVDDSDVEARQNAVNECFKNVRAFNATLPAGSIPLSLREDHVFPSSARDAVVSLMFNKYKLDNPGTSELPPAKDANWRDFYQRIWGSKWERTMKKEDIETLAEDCDELYKKCGMEPFFQRVVHDALVNASQKSTESTLIKIRNSVLLLRKRASNQVGLLESNNALKNSADLMDQLRITRDRVCNLQREGQHMQNTALARCIIEWHGCANRVMHVIEKHVNGEPEGWTDYIPYLRTSRKKYFGDEKIVGASVSEAVEMVQPALDELQHYVTTILREMLRKFVEDQYIQTLLELSSDFNEKVAVAISNASDELTKYSIKYALPKNFSLPLDDIKMQLAELPLPGSREYKHKVEKTAWWWFFGLVTWEETQVETVFELYPSVLRNKVLTNIASFCSDLNSKVSTHIETTINTLFDPFFVSISSAIEDIASDIEKVEMQLLQSQKEIQEYMNKVRLFSDELDTLEKDLFDINKQIGGVRAFLQQVRE